MTPIGYEILYFIKFISVIAVVSGVVFFLIDFAYGYSIVENISFMIGIITANVPEGLIMSTTVCIAMSSKRMAKCNVLVKNLESVETLGSTSCICTDKTGTLTQNKMTASNCFYNGKCVDISTNYEEVTKNGTSVNYNINDPGFKSLMESVALSTKATFSYAPTISDIKSFISL